MSFQAPVRFLNNLSHPQVPCLFQIEGDARYEVSGCSEFVLMPHPRYGQPHRRSTSSNSWYGSFLLRIVQAEYVDREIEIVQELSDKVLRYGPAMEDASSVCAELDCLLSFAEAARSFSYRRPRMVEDPIMDIVQGRYACVGCLGDRHLPALDILFKSRSWTPSFLTMRVSSVEWASECVTRTTVVRRLG